MNADFGCAQRGGFDGFLRDLVRVQEICVGFSRPAAEGAELASDEANIREVDIAIDDVRDQVAGECAAKIVGSNEQSEKVVSFGVSQN